MQRLKGIAATLLILALLAGTPMLLLALGSNPLSGGAWPTWQQITRIFTVTDDGTMLLGLIKIIAWLAWLLLAVLLLIEIGAALRGVKAPPLPGLHAPQGMLRSLVATAALLFIAAPMATGVAAAHAPAAPAPQHVSVTSHHSTTPTHKHHQQPAKAETRTVVKGDTLWDIAEDELGDGARYPEIFKASKKTVQPGGHHLTDPDVIDIGWKVTIPGTGKTDKPKPAKTTKADTKTGPVVVITPPAQTPVPTATAPATSIPSPATPVAEEASDQGWVTQTAVGVGTLLAAGVVALVRRRRRTQQRRRRPGAPMPLPTGTAAVTEQQLRTAADPLSVDTIDQALRSLAAHCHTTGEPLPDVRAARLTADAFDLYLAEPAVLPAPWTDQLDQTVWTLTVADQAADDHGDREQTTPAPYPALVTLGHDEEAGHVLLNLEHIGGLSLAGGTDDTREVLAALAVELATSVWADDLTITVVAAFAELDALGTGRIRYVPSISAVLDDLEARAAADREALGDTTLNAARAAGTATDAWTPEIVIIGSELTDRQADQLAGIIDTLPRVAIAAVSATTPVGQWHLTLSTDPDVQEAVLDPIQLALVPQRIPAAVYSDLLEMTALADVDELDPDAGAPEPTIDDVNAAIRDDHETPAPASAMPAVDDDTDPARPLPAALRAVLTNLTDDEPVLNEPVAVIDNTEERPEDEQPAPAAVTAPQVNVLGPVTIEHATGQVEPSRKARLVELAAYLVLNPGASHSQIDDAVWPNRGPGDNFNTRNPATTKLRRWLGNAPDGSAYVPRHQTSYSLHEAVTSDVAIWDRLVAGNATAAATAALEEAFQLVRGVPFEGVDFRRRYAWAEPLQQRLISDIVDVSAELTRRRIEQGRWRAAEESVVVGLRVEPAQEALWRLRILAAHEAGNKAAEAEAIDRLLAITDRLECDLEPETLALLDKLRGRSYRKAL